MRSRMARSALRVAVPSAGLVAAMSSSAVVAQASTTHNLATANGPLETLSAPVGLSAIGLGVVGMVAGVLRRKKAEIQPENQRKG